MSSSASKAASPGSQPADPDPKQFLRRRRKPRRRNAVPPASAALAASHAHLRVDDLNVGFDAANLRRCPGCGGAVYLWPCLACARRGAA